MITKNWMDIKKAAKDGWKLLFPLGVIEEHGPHLPLGSDIFWSQKMCELVKDEMKKNGEDVLIVPAYYWGINHSTGAFPGSFTLTKETMKRVLFEIFENIKNFGFKEIYCFNYHGDAHHIHTIAEAIQKANTDLDLNIKLVLESMDLELYGWNGDESFLLVSEPPYPYEWFTEELPSERGLFDIHGGAFETAVMNYLHPEYVNLGLAQKLDSYSLTYEGLAGGESTKDVVPLGYAGNPSGYHLVAKHTEEMIVLQVKDIARRIQGN